MREFKVGDLVKIVKHNLLCKNEHTFYTVITYISTNDFVYGPWKVTFDNGDFLWQGNSSFSEKPLNKDTFNVQDIIFITNDKELSEFAMKVLPGQDIDAKYYVEELIKQQDKSIVYE